MNYGCHLLECILYSSQYLFIYLFIHVIQNIRKKGFAHIFKSECNSFGFGFISPESSLWSSVAQIFIKYIKLKMYAHDH